MEINKDNSTKLLKKLLSFSGRATRKDFWMTILWLFLAEIVLLGIVAVGFVIYDLLGVLLMLPAIPIFALIALALFANVVRRLHDLGLSGFWICYLSPLGLPFMYCAYLMDADESAKAMVERIKNVGSPWLSWILAIFFWASASMFGQLLILLSPGQKQDNIYGSNPYVTE